MDKKLSTKENETDVFKKTHGAWKRKESLQQTAQKARAAFKKSMERSRS